MVRAGAVAWLVRGTNRRCVCRIGIHSLHGTHAERRIHHRLREPAVPAREVDAAMTCGRDQRQSP